MDEQRERDRQAAANIDRDIEVLERDLAVHRACVKQLEADIARLKKQGRELVAPYVLGER